MQGSGAVARRSNAVDLDLLDPEFIAHPHGTYEQLRATGPVLWNRRFGFWMVTTYDEAQLVLTDHERFSSDLRSSQRSVFGGATMIFSDPPQQTRLRRLASAGFSPRSIAELGPAVRDTADDLVRAAIVHDRFDVVEAIAGPMPVRTIARLLGVDAADVPLLQAASDEIVSIDLERVGGAARRRRAGAELRNYFAAAVRRPGDGTSLVAAMARRAPATATLEEVVATCVLLLIAGHETTTKLLANTVLAWHHHPAAFDLHGSDPHVATEIIDEALRYDGPVHALRRVARDDVAVGGQSIRRGESIVVLVASANRDPSRFKDADHFLPGRADAGHHLGLGTGVHHCLGSGLARVEAAAVLDALRSQLSGVSLVAPEAVEYVPSIFVRGPRRLEIEVHRRQDRSSGWTKRRCGTP